MAKKTKKTKKTTAERPIIYPDPKVKMCRGEKVLTDEQAKKLLGWEEETEEVKFGGDYLLKDTHGNKIRCVHNNTNRPFDAALAKTWESEILLGNWKLNGETMIIGETGQCLDCQHRLVGLILAVQEWESNKEKWPDWTSEPTMDCIVVTGIAEDDDTVNTINTGKPRSLADVLFRSPYFADLPTRERNKAARICSYAVGTIWNRVGEGVDGLSSRRTHTRSIDFIDRHQQILKCVRHIHDENGEGSAISSYMSPGYAAGLLYLMACSNSDGDNYGGDNPRDESSLNWDQWEKASDFWVLLAQGADELRPLRYALGNILDEDGGSMAEKCGIVINAWNLFSKGKKITEEKLQVASETNSEGVRILTEIPLVGGIDIGPSTKEPQLEPEPGPTPEKIEKRKTEERENHAFKKKSSGKKKKTTKKKTTTKSVKKKKTVVKKKTLGLIIGEHYWVNDPDGIYDGELIQILGNTCRIEVASGQTYEPLIKWVQTKEPI